MNKNPSKPKDKNVIFDSRKTNTPVHKWVPGGLTFVAEGASGLAALKDRDILAIKLETKERGRTGPVHHPQKSLLKWTQKEALKKKVLPSKRVSQQQFARLPHRIWRLPSVDWSPLTKKIILAWFSSTFVSSSFFVFVLINLKDNAQGRCALSPPFQVWNNAFSMYCITYIDTYARFLWGRSHQTLCGNYNYLCL